MKRDINVIKITVLACVWIVLLSFCSTLSASARKVNTFLKKSNIKGGFVVHAGCGDGTLIAEMGKNKQYVIQGLESDQKQVDKARQTISATGNYGRLSIKHWQGKKLPYVECRVYGLNMKPFSRGYLAYTKPVPEEIDDWPHYLYGSNNNAVSRDMAVGPPQRMQWVCGPAYARSHEINSSMAGMISAAGRIFYIWDEGPVGQPDQRFPSQWSLIGRDGFNGMLLWKIPMPDWGWRQWHAESRWDNPRERASMLRQLPRTTTRRLVAADEKLYITIGYEAPVSVLDAA
ncbi:MAG: hypothetical protein ACYS6K_29620, partial [Planctomycetota bacterium]